MRIHQHLYHSNFVFSFSNPKMLLENNIMMKIFVSQYIVNKANKLYSKSNKYHPMNSHIAYALTLLVLICFAHSFRLAFPSHQLPRHTAYMDNIVEAHNWFYGYGTTQEDYRLKLMEKSLETGSTLITCDSSRPFATADMESCEKCPPEMPLRNL